MTLEMLLLYAGATAYAAAAALAVFGEMRGRGLYQSVVCLVAAALVVHGAHIGMRWDRLDHGPYVTMFEVLSSNVWTLHAFLLAVPLVMRRLRPILPAALPVLQVLVAWMVVAEPVDSPFPVTYDTVWLPVHVWVGKVFLGIVVVAVGLSLIVLLRTMRPAAFPRAPRTGLLDEVIFRLVLLAFVFESLMLTAGAVWAQDAWGRFWQWDPLETWSFITWLAVATYLHLRVTRRPPPAVSAAAVVGVFVLAFATFFGMPFVSIAPHKGMI